MPRAAGLGKGARRQVCPPGASAHFVRRRGQLDTAGTVNERRVGPMQWIMPLAWCAVTAIIVASGLNVELAGGPTAAGFGYVFLVAGYGAAFKQGLALYSIAAAVLGLGFMLVPRMTGGRINKG